MSQTSANRPKIMTNAVANILGNSLQGSQVPNKNYWGFIAYSSFQMLAITTVLITGITMAPALGIPAAVVIVSRVLTRTQPARKLGSKPQVDDAER